MKKISFIFGLTLVAVILISFSATELHTQDRGKAIGELFANENNPFEKTLEKQAEVVVLNPATDINVIEIEEEVVLGIDTAAYLPIGFDAYKGYVWDVADLNVIEMEEEVELDFNVNDYLPANFNPYKA